MTSRRCRECSAPLECDEVEICAECDNLADPFDDFQLDRLETEE